MSGKNKKNGEPYQVIKDFFSFASMKTHRKYIYSMLKAAYSDDYWRKSDPGSLLLFQERTEELMKATYLFTAKKNNKTIKKKEAKLKNEVLEMTIDPATYVAGPGGDKMWDYFPRALSRKEFINPYLAFEKFFAFKNLDEWLAHFKDLINYALSLYGNESALDIDYLKTNILLQKLIEASHLIHVRVNKPGSWDARKSNREISGETRDVSEITAEDDNYLSDPYKVIDQFFMDGDVQEGRDDITRLFEAAFPDDLVVKKHYPSVLVFTFERIDKLIDAALSINREREEQIIDESKISDKILARVKALQKKTGKWDLFPYKLKPFEWLYPRLTIRAFFEHQPISHWRGKLHEILQAAISDNSICSVISDRSKLYLDCEHLERLIEAMWVIKIMEL